MFNDKYGLTQAVLKGRKTMTRRIVIYPSDLEGIKTVDYHIIRSLSGGTIDVSMYDTTERSMEGYPVFPQYRIGEVVAIAQSYKDLNYDPESLDRHPKDLSVRGLMKDSAGWNNKMFVKAYACKHHIKITNVKVERLQDISDDDCLKEGIFEWNVGQKDIPFYSFTNADIPDYFNPRNAFEELIDKISGKGTWESNPYVWVYEFQLID